MKALLKRLQQKQRFSSYWSIISTVDFTNFHKWLESWRGVFTSLKEECRLVLRRKLISDGMMYDRTSQLASNLPSCKNPFVLRVQAALPQRKICVYCQWGQRKCLFTQEINYLVLIYNYSEPSFKELWRFRTSVMRKVKNFYIILCFIEKKCCYLIICAISVLYEATEID